MSVLVNSQTPVTLIGGGPVKEAQLGDALGYAPLLIAADGGANTAYDLGHNVHHVIGDMDSFDPDLINKDACLHNVPEQMTTDLDKCLYSTSAPFYLGVGFLAGHLDHQLAACNSLLRAPDKPLLLIGERDICFLSPCKLSLNLPLKTRVSLFPMGDVTGKSMGLKWPLDGIDFAANGMIGTSNETISETVDIVFDKRNMLVILPVEHMRSVIEQCFVSTPAH